MGKFSNKSLQLSQKYLANPCADCPAYLCGTVLVKICIQQYIELWKQRCDWIKKNISVVFLQQPVCIQTLESPQS